MNRHKGLEKLMLHGKVEGRRARGRQRQTFMDGLSRFINTPNKSLSKLDIFRLTEDRETWKSLIVDVSARPDTLKNKNIARLSVSMIRLLLYRSFPLLLA
ncbi:hypothetical protein ElyMa_002215900 [Elysia marginata]|uniref:Uncharacterized protein n=1 Tax=Elysia marginata TaxID=1093978 RepID=A0AAV4FST5_9GAST|nr:hypothetical protein ElyMa_002215900 [Elysia marginata]